jgi:hypothetical protein
MNRRLPLAIVVAAVCIAASAALVGAQDEAADPPATQLRVALDRLLAEHAFLSMEVMRTGTTGGRAFTAAADALDENTQEIVSAIEGIYGADAGEAFGQQWRNHIAFLIDYARALSEGDRPAADLADQQLDRYVADFSALLSTAIPELPEAAVSGLIDEHVQQLEHVAAFESAQFGDAYPAIRDTYLHMFTVGDALATGIIAQFPDRFPGHDNAFSPATDLRIALDRLLGEHTYLAALAMRAHLTGARDAEEAAAALGENSAELETTITDIYGAPAGTAFGGLWESHVTSYVDYVAGLEAGDADAQEEALTALAEYWDSFSAFLAEANPYVSAAELQSHIRQHTDLLVRQAEQYAAGDYAEAYQTGREAFAHTGELSASLAGAIADQLPDRFARALPNLAMIAPEP